MINNVGVKIAVTNALGMGISTVSTVYPLFIMIKLGIPKSSIGRLLFIFLLGMFILGLSDMAVMAANSVMGMNKNISPLYLNYDVLYFMAIFFGGIVSNICLIYVMTLRNMILINNKRLFTISVILAVGIISTYIIYFVITMVNIFNGANSVKAFLTYLGTIIVAIRSFISAIFDFISNIYLLFYYHEYYFMSSSVMKHIRPQMEYRRRYIYFVLFTDIMAIPLLILAIFDAHIGGYVCITLANLFTVIQGNVMVDFVKFDGIRNEITIGDHTIYMYNDKSDNI